MNILLIGNGFDIAHGLPTKYTDFLEFCNKVKGIYKTYRLDLKIFEIQELNGWVAHDYVKKQLYYAASNRKTKSVEQGLLESNNNFTIDEYYDELFQNIDGNIWLDYFNETKDDIGENWIDFEKEISKVVVVIDKIKSSIEEKSEIPDLRHREEIIVKRLIKSLNQNMYAVFKSHKDSYLFINRLLSELEKTIRALEIYISYIIERIPISNEIKDLSSLDITHLVSFNYSNTYELLYGSETTNYDYIHGKADKNNIIETNNMVLGIDEYLPENIKDIEVDFIAFKKFYQRIHKATGCKYKEWVDEINQDRIEEMEVCFPKRKTTIPFYGFDNKHYLYIYGHSLDETDKDILKELILNDNVYTTIFYYEKRDEDGNGDNGRKDLGEKIANLVKVIGQDELIKRTGGSTKTIEFKLQSSTTNSEV